MSNWTKNQKQAIDTRGKNLLISAAAGSGKTAVMVERIVNLLIEEKIDIEDMLIVTFTNAAAGEMKERIQKKLQDRRKNAIFEGQSPNRDLADFLTKQIQNIPKANISTVHSFCIQVIRDNYNLVEIDPSFKLLNESQGLILRQKAMDDTFEKKYDETDTEFELLIASYGEAKGDNRVRETVQNIDRFVQAQPYPKEWLLKQEEFYKNLGSFDNIKELLGELTKTSVGKKMIEQLEEQLDNALNSIDEALEFISYPSGLSFEEKLLNEREMILRLVENLKKGLDIFFSIDAESYETFRKKKSDEISDEDWETIKKLRNDAKTIYVDMTSKKRLIDTENFVNDINYLSRIVSALINLVIQYQYNYSKIKLENNVLDFGDLEHLTLKILENESVRKNLREKYKYIFYDEYQDTNLVQETIVNSICRSDNLFFVGDVKQSIYRFRLADPTIFNRKYDLYSSEEQSEKIDLSKNFRSRKEILAFCNLVFKNIMSEKYGEVDYKNEAHQLNAGRDDFYACKDNIELVIIEKDKNEKKLISDKAQLEILNTEKFSESYSHSDEKDFSDGANENLEDDNVDKTAVELEAVFVAKKILELRQNGVEFKDIAILFRALRGKAKIFEKILASYKIPSYVDYTSSHFDKLEIKCLIDYLKVIDNKKQDEALIGAMSSVFGNFDNEELIKIREAYPSGEFYLASQNYARDFEDELATKLREFYKKIARSAGREKMMSLPDFIWYIAESTGFNVYISGLDDAVQRLHNIRSLVQKAGEYEQGEALGLFGFLRHIDAILKGKADGDESTILETENVVKIMSIHKSKGLEFNTVFVCDLGKNINEKDLSSDIILHNELGIGLKYKDAELGVKSDNALRLVLKNEKQRENISEEIRILYVALTRAVDRLYLVATVKSAEGYAKKLSENGSKSVLKGRNYLNWIGTAIFGEEKGETLREIVGAQGVKKFVEKDAIYGIKILKEQDLFDEHNSLNEKNKEIENVEISEESKSLLDLYTNFEYRYLADTKKESKKTVSELTKEYKNKGREEIEMFSAIKRPTFSADTRFSSSEIGTVVHFIMENIEIKSYSEETLAEQLESMKARELLTDEELAIVPKDKIINFFESELGRRMINSPRVHREQSFLMKDEEFIIEGVIDCYFEEGDELVILDYKTDSVIDEKKHIAQIQYYKQAVENMENKKVKQAYIYWISHNKFTEILS